MTKILSELFQIIEDRKRTQKDNSYSVKMLNSNSEKVMRKLCEEALEVGLASISGDRHKNGKEQIIYESADLIYHLFLLMVKNGVSLQEVEEELKKRMKNA